MKNSEKKEVTDGEVTSQNFTLSWGPKIFKFLTLSLLLTIQEAFVDSADQDQTAQNVQSDLWSTLSTFLF